MLVSKSSRGESVSRPVAALCFTSAALVGLAPDSGRSRYARRLDGPPGRDAEQKYNLQGSVLRDSDEGLCAGSVTEALVRDAVNSIIGLWKSWQHS